MDFIINFLTQQVGIEASSPLAIFWFLFKNGGFVFVIFAILRGLAEVWLEWRQNIYAAQTEWVYLAIDVPKDSEQSPKAVEQIFNHLMGALKGPNFQEKWWMGYFQQNFSLELVSIEGYIQYIIRTPKVFRDLAEAAIYAQYPEAQITEIEDYTHGINPETFKEQGYDFWGSQFKLSQDEVYPIKTYPLFEHTINQQIIDPMAAILEIFSRMAKGEQAWMQIVIKPVRSDWKEKSVAKVKEIIGAPQEAAKPGVVNKALEVPGGLVTKMGDVVFGPAGAAEEKEAKLEIPSKMLYLSPGERVTVEAIDRKAEKQGFKTKIRYIYLVKNTKLVKTKGASGFIGFLRQFDLLNSNGIIPIRKATTKSDIIFPKRQASKIYKIQKKLLRHYKSRTSWGGYEGFGFILNTEELASIYHFPYKGVVAPTLKMAEAKRAEAPFALPVEGEAARVGLQKAEAPVEGADKIEVVGGEKRAAPPGNLPM